MTEVPLAGVPPFAGDLIGPFRLAEWALALLSLLALGRAGSPSYRLSVAATLLGAATFHVWGEGVRWQAAPLYLTALLALFRLAGGGWPPPALWVSRAAGLGGVTAAAVLCVLVPIFRLPPPVGPMAVGTRLYEIDDTGRPEPHAPGGGGRRLMVQLWYPARAHTGSGRAAYRTGDPKPLLDYQRLVETQSRIDAVPAGHGPHPLILFAHAWGGTRIQNTALMQDLASRGFVVAAFDRPYNAGYVRFADGTLVTPPRGMVLDLSNDAALERTLALGDVEAAIGAADAGTVLDALGNLADPASGGPFAGLIETDKAAILGHSFGGAVAAEACRRDPRFIAALNLDGWIFGAARRDGVPCRYMLINDGSEVPPPSALRSPDPATRAEARMQIGDRDAELRSFRRYGGWDLTIRGASHEDFTDRPYYARLRPLTGAGSLPVGRVDALVRRYAAAWATDAFEERSPRTLLGSPLVPHVVTAHYWPRPLMLDASTK